MVGCGGTRLASAASPAGETVWNSNGGGTGGGISDLFAIPAYQAHVDLPVSANHDGRKGRGVPDVAGDADPDTGYRVVVDGARRRSSAGRARWPRSGRGCSPLINATAAEPVGQPHAALYAHAAVFNDVRHGNNQSGKLGYAAAAGWDACTGLGSPRGEAVAQLFRTA